MKMKFVKIGFFALMSIGILPATIGSLFGSRTPEPTTVTPSKAPATAQPPTPQPNPIENYAEFIGTNTKNGLAGTKQGDRCDVFVIKGESDEVKLLEFCRFYEKRNKPWRYYFAFFFDDKEFAKVPFDFNGGFNLDDEQTMKHVKAMYLMTQLTVYDTNSFEGKLRVVK